MHSAIKVVFFPWLLSQVLAYTNRVSRRVDDCIDGADTGLFGFAARHERISSACNCKSGAFPDIRRFRLTGISVRVGDPGVERRIRELEEAAVVCKPSARDRT